MMVVYIIQSLTNHSFYTGMTNNLERRLAEHNAGLSRYTKKFTPWIVVYAETCENRELARKREKYLKSSEGKRSVLKK